MDWYKIFLRPVGWWPAGLAALLLATVLSLVTDGQIPIPAVRPPDAPDGSRNPQPATQVPFSVLDDNNEDATAPPADEPDAAMAQSVNADLLARNQPLILQTEAFAGQPWGIGRVKYRLRPGDAMIHRTGATLLTEANQRILYPVITQSPVKEFIENFTGANLGFPDDVYTIWFLFSGQTPLQLTLHGSDAVTFNMDVGFAKRRRQFDRFVKRWWDSFNAATNEQIDAGDYPAVFETYLKSMVGLRMGLQVPRRFQQKKDPLLATFQLMFDMETIRNQNIEQAMLRGIAPAEVNLPLPQSIAWTPLLIRDLPEEIPIESLARCVPAECFYLRFGTWENQLWLQRLTEEFGGNLGRMIQLRGFKYKIQSKFLDQLAIQSTEFDRLFGGNLIDDVAVIGMDTYFDDGAAVGVMLHAKNTDALKNNLRAKRRKFVDANKNLQASIRTIDFQGKQIEYLSTPDNRYRSFHAVAGNCHLMSTSLTLAQRFLEAAEGKGSLADTQEFRFARHNMPLDRDDTIFVYASTAFLQNLLTPQYQIELRRRNNVITDIMMLEMAAMAAANEGVVDVGIDNLVSRGYLPRGFGFRPDFGSVQTVGDTWIDSVRGRRGFFVPIPDLPVTTVSDEESQWYAERAAFFTGNIQTLDPMLVAMKRYQHDDNIERVVFDARLAPFGEQKYGWAMEMLGQPLEHQIAHDPQDIVSLQASMKGGRFISHDRPHQLFAAIQDYLDPSVDLRPDSKFRLLDAARQVPGYVGGWPNPGYLDMLPNLGGRPDAGGYTYSRLLKLWRLQWGEFSVVSFDQQRLENLKPHLQVVPTERPAQVRLEIGDLANSNLSAWANSVNYRRSWQTSIANTRLLNMLTQQFRVDPGAARTVIERMLDAELVCSLDGQYELAKLATGRQIWYSTAWPSFTQPIRPDEHIAPVMKWFRGLELQVTKADTQFSIHGLLDIQRIPTGGALPSFDLFGGFGNLFGQ